ncbi:MAG: ATP synthase subunit I [Desulfuromonadaceae bacterium]|nr:ATP synthase subunit I [Desulfuromonadaceae bacterium]
MMTTTKKVETDRDEQLPRQLAIRNWVILCALLILSLLWHSKAVTLGVLAGGLTAIIGFYWLHHALVKTLQNPTSFAARGFKHSYFVRLGALAATLVVLIVVLKVNPLGLAVGLSTVILNILWVAIERSMFTRRP